MKKKVIVAVAVLLLVVLVAGGVVYAKTTSQKISFVFDPTDGTGDGQLYSMIPPYTYQQAAASFDGNLLTEDSGNQKITTLTGTLRVNPNSSFEQVYTVQVKPDGMYSYSYPPTPGCSVSCHVTTAPAQVKYQGQGSNVQDGAGVLSWQTITGLPVPPTTRSIANFWGMLVSKDQALNFSFWDRLTPTIN